MKDIKGYEGLYSVTEDGRVLSHSRSWMAGRKLSTRTTNKEKFLTKSLTRSGYYTVGLTKKNKSRNRFLHRLFAQAFLPNPENKPCINHKNGIKLDNRIENLEWVTHTENTQHAFRTGLIKNSGENHALHKLNEKQVIAIRSEYKGKRKGIKQSEFAKRYNVSESCIQCVLNCRNWKYLL